MGVTNNEFLVASGEERGSEGPRARGRLRQIFGALALAPVAVFSLSACGPNSTSNNAEAPAPGPERTGQVEAGSTATPQEAETKDSTIIGTGKFRVPNLLGDLADFCAAKMGLDPNKDHTLLKEGQQFGGEADIFKLLAKANGYPDDQALIADLGAESAAFYKKNGINEPYVAELKVPGQLCKKASSS